MKRIFFLIMVCGVFGCKSEDVPGAEQEVSCFDKSFLEAVSIEPGQCVSLQEFPDKTFTLLELGSFEKQELWVPAASISYSIIEENSFQEWYNILIYEDHENEGISFSGRFHFIVDENVRYTVYVDNIEFSETETAYIFERMTVRFAEYDPEW